MNEHNERGMELNYFGDECYLHSLDTDINENQYINNRLPAQASRKPQRQPSAEFHPRHCFPQPEASE